MSVLPLLNKRCLITGGSRGIGLAIAAKFASKGGSCVLVARNSQHLKEALSSLPVLDEDNKHTYRVGDVGKAEFWKATASAEPNINILINAAGISQSSLLMATPWDTVDEITQTNLLGSIYAAKVYMRSMIRRREGCIINISSVLAIRGGKGSTVYTATKAGILGLSRALADEVAGSNVRVNTILPGYIATDMTEKMSSLTKDLALKATPLNRFGTVEEVASAALFLATNTFCTGSSITIDGGLSAV